jgi:3'(2'), 5'-bisphosphate nucleotidase
MREEWIQLKAALIEISKDAGKAIMDIYKDESLFKIEQKKDDSPLTAADQSANAVIMEGLQKLAIQFPVISEENKAIEYDERKHFETFWLVDPLDGTKEFIKRNGEFTVNIALIHNQSPVMGFVYAPALDEMYYAIKGHGAFFAKGNDEYTPLEAKNYHKSDEGLKLVCSRSHLNESTEKYVGQFKNPELVAKGSSLKFLIIALGEAHEYPRLAPTMEWDTGAAQIVLEEAGGAVIQHENGKPLVYNKENLLNPHFVALGNEQKN